VTSIGVALLVEEHRGDIAAAWRAAAGPEPALGFAIAPILRELSLALREEGGAGPGDDAWARIAVLVRSSARPAQVAREVKLLHGAIWDALDRSGEPVLPADRRALDAWLLDATVACLERLERARARLDALDRGPGDPAARPRPPPLPQPRRPPA
jgi:hypothetical protein